MTRRLTGDSATGWVASLPPGWTTGPERLVLYVLALDAQHGITHSGRAVLSMRAGMGTDQLRVALHSLCVPTDVRPPLLERMPKRRARDSDRYRLAPRDHMNEQRLLPLTGLVDV